VYRELLPDRERVLGAGHPETLATRWNIAFWTGRCGDPAGALRVYRELLPDMERVLGAGHPDTLATRGNITNWAEVLSASTRDPEDTTEAGKATNAPAPPTQETF